MASNEYEFLKKSIQEYLAEENVDYVLLLSGKWGCGKTYLIDEIMKEREEENCKISLNGVSTIESLKTRLFLHSIPKREKLKNWDLNPLMTSCISLFDHFPWGKFIEPTLSGIAKPLLENVLIKRPVIFDDIERTKIDIKEFFGFLRVFQDEIKQPIVVIGCEDKIKESMGDSKTYSEIKEKVIGRTLIKHANLKEIITQFTRCFDLPSEWLGEVAQVLLFIFDVLQTEKDENGKCYENLRAFKIALKEVSVYLKHISSQYKECREFVIRFIKVAVALKYAAQVGRFTEENWNTTVCDEQQRDFKDTIVESFLKRFNESSVSLASLYPVLSLGTWKSLIFGEVIDWDAVNDFIGKWCEPFKRATSEPYVKLISFETMPKDEIEENIRQLDKKIANREIIELGEIFSAFSIRVSLLSVREKVFAENIEQQLSQLRVELEEYVNELLENNKLEIEDKDSYAVGHMFERTPLSRIVGKPEEFYLAVLQRRTEKEDARVLNDVLDATKMGDSQCLFDKLTEDFREKPVFRVDGIMNPERMVALFTRLSSQQLYSVRVMFYHRYRFNVSNWKDFLGWCIPEREAFIKMEELLIDEIDKIKYLDCYRANNYIKIQDDIEKVIARINELTKDNTVYAE